MYDTPEELQIQRVVHELEDGRSIRPWPVLTTIDRPCEAI